MSILAELQDAGKDRHQPMQVERAGATLVPARRHPLVAARDRLPQQPAQGARAGATAGQVLLTAPISVSRMRDTMTSAPFPS